MDKGKGIDPSAGPSTIAGVTSTTDVAMSGQYDPDSLDGLDQGPDHTNIKFEQLLESFRSTVPVFSGNAAIDYCSGRSWVREVVQWRRGTLRGIENLLFIAEVKRRLSGKAKKAIGRIKYAHPAQLLEKIQKAFPHLQFQSDLIQLIESGEAFAGADEQEVMTRLEEYTGELEDSPVGLLAVKKAIQKMYPALWQFVILPAVDVDSGQIIATLQDIQDRIHRSDDVKVVPYGKMSVKDKPKTSDADKEGAKKPAKAATKQNDEPPKKGPRKKKPNSKLDKVLELFLGHSDEISSAVKSKAQQSAQKKD
ncbi:hypothetical protein H4S06_000677 [Coemansia sp. BCRC 34490]|nr:hypothetical protein H4S06_000677 [Coemansia sp. BCRC 34490]